MKKSSAKNISESAAGNTRTYRPDIDGLRAIAVTAVLFFHAFPKLLPGGFIGVDVFFVISGYLITGILLNNLARGKLGLFNFYRHRVLRIFPALLLVLTTCFAAGWLVLFQDEYAALGASIAASAVFISNFLLWSQAGYFDAASTTKPLLHLWSLAIEEQFYVLWPLLLWLSWRLRLAPMALVAICLAGSFGCCLILARSHPVADFYAPAARFWEILAGALLVCIERGRVPKPGRILREALSLAGGAMLIGALAWLNGSMAYPGFRAALPAAAATCLLAAGPQACLNRWALALRPMVWIGLVSYPLYLWHWPLLSFARILVGAQPPAAARAALLGVSLALAVVTYFCVERPLRFGKHGRVKMTALCLVMVAVGAAGLDDSHRHGLESRYIVKHAPATGMAALTRTSPFVTQCALETPDTVQGWCETDTREKPSLAVWGDSRGDALYWSLVSASTQGQRWMFAGRPGCAPIAGMLRVTHVEEPATPADGPLCNAFSAAVLAYILRTPSIHVVLIVTARRVLEREGYAPDLASKPVPDGAYIGLSNAVTVLQNSGLGVAFVEDNPFIGDSADCAPRVTGFRPLDRLLPRLRGGECNMPYATYEALTASYRAGVARLQAAHPALLVFDPIPLLCDAKDNICPMVQDGHLLYSYGDHISTFSGGRIAAVLLPMLARLSPKP